VHGLVRVTAEDAVGIVLPGILQGTSRNFRRHAKPARVQPVNQSCDRLALEVKLLKLKIERRSQSVQSEVVDLEAIELMTMNRDVPQAVMQPGVMLVDTHAHQVRHDIGEPVVVIAFHPNHLNPSLRIR